MTPPSLARRAIARRAFVMVATVVFFALLARAIGIEIRPHDAPPFTYSFHVDGVLEEASTPEESSSEYWWLDSGGRLIIEDGVGKTIHEALPSTDRWRRMYAESSPEDTSDGRYPQNLFRLVTQRAWDDVSVSARFRVVNNNESPSENQNESNGLLLMSRYKDGDNLYYAGIRVDGRAVIKKKTDGAYTTLAEHPVFEGEYSGTNLLPYEWIHLKSDVRTNDRIVDIKLYMKKEGETEWSEILSVQDTDRPIFGMGHTGIRTDFMDVEFDDFRAEEL